ncbi:MAG: zinc-ribbon domain-containing protein [Paracoccaceae bacterium]|nr:zinc-ribbon domain-containing protein [Paracoccaceae bacterium]
MRLICPNCGAQYEVPVEVIPDAGRDVQCSNCGHTWFQAHPDQGGAAAEEPDDLPVGDALGEEEPEAPQEPDWAEDDTPADTQEAPPKARELDSAVTDVLREEREWETQQREAEREALESQPDLGLAEPDEDEAARRARQSRERMAKIRGEEPLEDDAGEDAVTESGRAAAEAAAAAAGSRRDLLPDVEEINQTLRASSEPRVVDSVEGREPVDLPKQRSGFGRGFFLIVLVAAVAIGVYAYAEQIGAAVPAVAPILDSYVAGVDQARVWLDTQVGALMQILDQFSSEAAGGAEDSTASE